MSFVINQSNILVSIINNNICHYCFKNERHGQYRRCKECLGKRLKVLVAIKSKSRKIAKKETICVNCCQKKIWGIHPHAKCSDDKCACLCAGHLFRSVGNVQPKIISSPRSNIVMSNKFYKTSVKKRIKMRAYCKKRRESNYHASFMNELINI